VDGAGKEEGGGGGGSGRVGGTIWRRGCRRVVDRQISVDGGSGAPELGVGIVMGAGRPPDIEEVGGG
jgi:hypothetical protein